jgi:hypothetical protein
MAANESHPKNESDAVVLDQGIRIRTSREPRRHHSERIVRYYVASPFALPTLTFFWQLS